MAKYELIQPLVKAAVKSDNYIETVIKSPITTVIYEFEAKDSNPVSLKIIPSPFQEWIICYNKNNSKSEFFYIGAQKKIKEITLPHFDYYLGARFDDNGCFFNKGLDVYPAILLDQTFSYSPDDDSLEHAFVLNLKKCRTHVDKVDAFKSFLKTAKQLYPVSETAGKMMAFAKNFKGNITVAKLSESFEYSVRQTTRIFNESIGFGPKEYFNILRFNEAVRRLCESPNSNIAELINGLCYSDDSHFLRSFKAYTGLSVKEFIKLM